MSLVKKSARDSPDARRFARAVIAILASRDLVSLLEHGKLQKRPVPLRREAAQEHVEMVWLVQNANDYGKDF